MVCVTLVFCWHFPYLFLGRLFLRRWPQPPTSISTSRLLIRTRRRWPGRKCRSIGRAKPVRGLVGVEKPFVIVIGNADQTSNSASNSGCFRDGGGERDAYTGARAGDGQQR